MKPQVKILLSGLLLIIVLFCLPTEYYLIEPGPTLNTKEFISTSATEERNHIYAPSVRLYEMKLFSLWESTAFNKLNANVFYVIYGTLHPNIHVNKLNSFLQEGTTSDAFEEVMRQLTQGSIYDVRAYVSQRLNKTEEELNITLKLKNEGSSVSSAFALEAVNQLGPKELTRGLKVAAVGKIAMDGEIYPVGAEIHKAQSAENSNMDILFISNRTNTDNINQMKLNVNVIPVHSVDEAIAYLEAQ
mgnify:CR=1 FL=1